MGEFSPPPPSNAPAPKCISLLLCEAAHLIAGSANQIIVNTFNSLGVSGCPILFPKITVVYTLTSGHGNYELDISLVPSGGGPPLIEARQRIELGNPLAILDGVMTFMKVPIPVPGRHWVEVRCGSELIGQRPFYVGITPGAGALA